ncbi:patatin-like phospholipase family protein [Actinomadura sp. DC4]|uniref:patatin-like phospholipase family protein n=1 Tax=Actinomadura sp. DC4 TaxID=3055069 RepID=UPI0025B15989|nr:patatin-like phospholipase family protein [Actinomadura sp. DC4]MDN3355965.1 patatin-like phospholipase family protein [Actinomadura sp. DC4]
MTIRCAVVLGGGGLAGMAWESGVLAGLASAGVDVGGADLVVGTSAGSVVGAWLAGGRPVTESYQRVVDAPLPGEELPPAASLSDMTAMFRELARDARGRDDWRRRVGARALTAETPPESARIEVMAARLPVHTWPETELAVVAADANTGERRVFRHDSGAGLVDAVTASCALPLLWPPVTIGGARYVDGGIHSVTNADLAKGYDRVLILAPVTDGSLKKQVGALRKQGAQVHVIELDADSEAAIGGALRDPSTRLPAAKAGHAQGVATAPAVAALWQGHF